MKSALLDELEPFSPCGNAFFYCIVFIFKQWESGGYFRISCMGVVSLTGLFGITRNFLLHLEQRDFFMCEHKL